MEEDDIGGLSYLNVDSHVFNITHTQMKREIKDKIVSEVSELINKLDFISATINHK